MAVSKKHGGQSDMKYIQEEMHRIRAK
ncbi:hypothetical protein CCACVL1_27755 [Corchorus capsularis]|uniref:Uncharacterized protein n=1 Tax=Corchorus capsularis TaxID=210143 RepID=A0A1R3G8U1_COCAP|nr:hypothetical protein CCACVL1_27755 [Corchorus capsularis]